MGLLSAVGRRAGRFVQGAGDALAERFGAASRQTGLGYMPVTSTAIGAGVGGLVGGASGDPNGAANGALIGAGVMGGRSLGRTLGSAVMGGLRRVAETVPEQGLLFEQTKAQMVRAMRRRLENTSAPPLLQEMAKQDTGRAMERIMGARNRQELLAFLDEIEGTPGQYLPHEIMQYYGERFR